MLERGIQMGPSVERRMERPEHESTNTSVVQYKLKLPCMRREGWGKGTEMCNP